MDDNPRFQFSIVDVLLVTVLVAGILAAVASGQAEIAFSTASFMLLGIWNRPVILRLWAVGILGLGSGLFSAGCNGRHGVNLPRAVSATSRMGQS